MSWFAQLFAQRPAGGIGPGHLVLVVGPSGAGKDTLLAHARHACPDNQVVFPRRVITRPSSAAEDHDTVSDEAFDRALADGAFAIWWRAHELKYGIPKSIDADIRSGRTVVCNVSRTTIGEARARYSNVTVVMVTAPPDVLAARLAQRGRATDGSLAGRINRIVESGDLDPDVVINNVGPVEGNAERLLDVILWRFVPATP